MCRQPWKDASYLEKVTSKIQNDEKDNRQSLQYLSQEVRVVQLINTCVERHVYIDTEWTWKREASMWIPNREVIEKTRKIIPLAFQMPEKCKDQQRNIWRGMITYILKKSGREKKTSETQTLKKATKNRCTLFPMKLIKKYVKCQHR